jgi:hypothetical protein
MELTLRQKTLINSTNHFDLMTLHDNAVAWWESLPETGDNSSINKEYLFKKHLNRIVTFARNHSELTRMEIVSIWALQPN